ncbi:putative cholinesterase [Aspergillus affinis]|uniref:putative cholinesterase n=1 Tax=Aspergillus affinis TaxID=1070780 RepID=UPI0022FE872A|nr:carboxylesterase [Aspergillus affinis]KAI9043578.1 carboxylesterase [Aspergillus affinis]
MQLPLLIVASLCGTAWTAPAPALIPHADALGTLQVLHYNNLGPKNNGTSAVFVHDRLTNGEASARCAAIGEHLYPLPGAPLANRTELDYQFDYLVFSESIQGSDDIWVAANSSGCLAYSPEQKDFISAPCTRKLSALCTSRVPPTTDKNRAAVPSSKISVASRDYTITGFRDARSFRFLGIPFANPPVNALRLAPPQPYTGVKQIDALQVSASCIQSDSAFGTLGSDISEDCLYLNVYTPVLPPSARNTTGKPVAVYFYGGAFTQGSASMIDYDGGNLASRNDVIVVTVNYRVGVLGWLATGNLTTGNYGTRDQIQALRWVQQHIAAFGGDPSRVTIFGQSAGGQSVVALLSSPTAAPLFSAAIAQSAPVDLPWFTRDVYTDLVVPHIAPALGCPHHTTPEASLVACLRSLPATAFLDNSTAFESGIANASNATAYGYLHASPMLASIEPLLPILDPEAGIIADQFHNLLASGNSSVNRVPTLFTTVADEAALYVPEYASSMKTSPAALSTLLNLAYPPDLANALLNATAHQIQGRNTSLVPIISSFLTASEWTCPLSSLLNLTHHHSKAPIYNIQFPKGHMQTILDTPPTCSPLANNTFNATCHAADVLPIWGNLNSKTKNVAPYYGANDLHLSQVMEDVFGAFFRTRNPNPEKEWLATRGVGYSFSKGVFYGDNEESGDRIHPVGKGSKTRGVSSLGLKLEKVQDPGDTAVCRVFEEYGHTYDRARMV